MGAICSCCCIPQNEVHGFKGDDHPLQPLQDSDIKTPLKLDGASNEIRSPDQHQNTGVQGETESLDGTTTLAGGEKTSWMRSKAARTAAEGLKLALRLTEKTLDEFPIPGVKAAVGVVLTLIEEVEKTSSNADTLMQLQAHVTFLRINALEPLQTLSEDDMPDGMQEDVTRLISTLQQVGSSWDGRGDRGVFRRFVEATADENELKTFAGDVKQAVEQFQFSVAIRSRLSDRRQEKQLEVIHATQKANHEEKIFRDRARLVSRLRHAEDAQYNTGRLGAHSTCFEGTRIDVINKIISWLETGDNISVPQLFWLNGLAGIGKSTIATTIARHADKKGILAGSFFFSRGDEELTDPTLVFPTLSFQMATLDESLMASIGRALELDPLSARAGMQIQLQKLIVEPLKAISSGKQMRLLFVLDALDECRDDARAAAIVKLLLSHLPLIPFVRVLLTSRPESHIQQPFSGAVDHKEFILHDIERDIVQGDIRLYLGECLKEIAIEKGLSGWPKETDVESLVQMSGSPFVYAATGLRFIRRRNPVRQMEILLGVQRASGTKPYAQLDVLYMQILHHGLPLDGDNAVADQEVDDFQMVVGTLVLLRNPISLRALSVFTEVEPRNVTFIFEYLQSVVVTPPSRDEPLQIYHPSFRDFLTLPNRCPEPRYAIQLPDTEKRLTLRCLQLLVNHLRRNILNLEGGPDALLNENIVGLEGLLASAFPPEVRYACLHWSDHIGQVKHDDQDVVSLLYTFASRYLLFWFEAMSLLGQITRAIAAMRDANSWVGKTSHIQLKTLMYDGYRFAWSHKATIEVGALQVYHSALPFTPHNTLLYKTYEQETAHSMRVLHGVPEGWSPCLASLAGGHGHISAVAYSHEGTQFVLGFKPGAITMHAASSGGLLSSFEHPAPEPVLSLAFLIGDRSVIVGTTAGVISEWNVLTASIVRSYEGHTSSTNCVAVCAAALTIFASASDDTTIRLWSVSTGECACVLSCHDSPVRAVAFMPNGAHLLSGSDDGVVRIWNVSNPSASSELQVLSAHVSGIRALAIAPDGRTYCTGSSDHKVKIFAIDAQTPTFTLVNHAAGIIWLAYSINGATLLSVGDNERHARLWNTSDGTLKGLTRGYITQAAFSPNGEQLVTASSDGIFRIWEAKDPSPTIDPIDHTDWVVSVEFSPDGKLLATGGNENDRTVKIWDAIAGTLTYTLIHHWAVYSLAFSGDGSMLVTGSGDSIVRVWDVASGNQLLELSGHDHVILEVQFTENDRQIISRTPNTRYTWDVSSLEEGSGRAVGVLQSTHPEHTKQKPGGMLGTSQGYQFSMGAEHRVYMGKERHVNLIGAVQEEYRITGFAFHTDRVVFACTDGSTLILDVSPIKRWLGSCRT